MRRGHILKSILYNDVHRDACGRPLSVQLTNNGSKIVILSPTLQIDLNA